MGAATNNLEEVHEMQFVYPYKLLATLDTQLTLWTWEPILAFKPLVPVVKLDLLSPKGKSLNCNKMFILVLKNGDFLNLTAAD